MSDTERSFSLVDDGTLDTVIKCTCGAEYRFNYEPCLDNIQETSAEADYQSFIDWVMTGMDEEHECGEDD